MAIGKPRTRELSYLGARAVVTETNLDGRRNGKREIVTRWIDAATPENGGWPAGSVTRKVIEGDGRYEGFIVHESETLIESD